MSEISPDTIIRPVRMCNRPVQWERLGLVKMMVGDPIVPVLQLAGNVAPVVLGGDVRGRLRNMVSVSFEQGDGQGNNSVVAIAHCERQADETVAVIVDETANLDVAGALRGNNDFGHGYASPCDSEANLAGGKRPSPGKCTAVASEGK